MLHEIPNLLTKIRHDGFYMRMYVRAFGLGFNLYVSVCVRARLNSILNSIQHENEIPISECKDG